MLPLKNNNPLPQPAPEISRPESPEDQALVPQKTDWLRIGQFAFSSLAAFILVGIFLVSTLFLLIRDSTFLLGLPGGSELSPYLFAAGLGCMGLLMVPSAVYAARGLFGSGQPRQLRWGKFAWIGYIAPLPLLLGFGIQNGPDWARGFLPVAHVLANTAGVIFLLNIVWAKIPGESPGRFWGALAAGLGLTPLVTFFLEILILFGIGLVWMGLIGLMPEVRQELLDLTSRLQTSSASSEDLQLALGRFAASPGVLFTLFTYVAFLIPVVEELLKPAAVWLLLRRKLQPWEGFLIGATSGAGYALFENLTIGAAGDVWTFVTITRLGTAAVHIFTAGMMGWGLASAFTEKEYGRAVGAFFWAVFLHGAWNGMNVLSALGEYPAVRERLGGLGASLADFAPAALVLIALGCFWGLIRANKTFRRAIMAGSN